MTEENESDKKVVGGLGITAGGNISFDDVSGQFAIGEHIYQINLIYNDFRLPLKEGKFEEIPENLREQLDNHLSRIKEAESSGTRLSPDVHYTLGLSAYYKRDFDTAESYLIKAIKQDPDNLKARNLLCTIYATRSLHSLSQRRYEEVIDSSKKAESYFQYESIAESLIVMGYVYKNMYLVSKERQYLNKAKEKFEIALSLDSQNLNNIAGARNGLGNFYSLVGDNDAAINMHLEAITISPQYASAHNDLAIVYEAKMQNSTSDKNKWRLKAIEEWKKAVDFGKKDPAFSMNLIATIEKHIQELQQKDFD